MSPQRAQKSRSDVDTREGASGTGVDLEEAAPSDAADGVVTADVDMVAPDPTTDAASVEDAPIEDAEAAEPEERSNVQDQQAEREVCRATATGFSPLRTVTAIGDEGRQPEILMNLGPLTVGVSDTELEFCSVGPYEVRAAATRGYSHRYAGTPRQDMFCLGANEDWLVFAIADGVSAGAYSHVAAETASRAAVKFVLDQTGDLENLDWVSVCARVSRRIMDEAGVRKLADLSDAADRDAQVRAVRAKMCTTAVVAALQCTPKDDGSHDVWLAVLAGDSSAYIIDGDSMKSLAGGKQNGATISSTSVDPLPGAAQPEILRVGLLPGQAIVLASDGLGDPVGDGDGPVGEELVKRWTTPPPASQFFDDINFFRRSYDDDRSAVVAWLPNSS